MGGGVIGLTTAASIWVVAAIGASIGMGAYYVALITLIGVMLVLVIVNPVYGFFPSFENMNLPLSVLAQ